MKPTQKPKPPRRFKKVKRCAIAFLALSLICILSFPVWSVWLVKPLASMAGVEIQSVESLSWDRWQIKGLSLNQPTAKLQAATIELPSLTELGRLYLSSGPGTQSLLIENWLLEIDSQVEAEARATPPQTLGELVALGKNGLSLLESFLKDMHLKSGAIRIDNKDTIAIPNIELNPKAFKANLEYLPKSLPLSIAADFQDTWTLDLEATSLELSSHFELRTTAEQLKLDGEITTSQNPIKVSAEWDANQSEFAPTSFQANAQRFALDERYPIWENAPKLYLDSAISWANQKLSYQITGGESLEPTPKPQIQIAGSGSLEIFEIETANVSLPYLEITNDSPIRIDPSLSNPLADAQLTAKLDFSQIPAIEAKGTLHAKLRTQASSDGLPIIIGTLQGADISFFDTLIKSIGGEIELHGQALELRSLSLNTAAGSTVSGEGGFDLASQTITPSRLELALLNESETLRSFAPELNWKSLSSTITISGPAANPDLQVTLDSKDLLLPGAKPFSITAETKGTLPAMKGALSAKNTEQIFQLEFASQATAVERTFEISKFALSDLNSNRLIGLDSPFSVRIQNSDSSITSAGFSLSGANELKIELQDISLTQDQLSLSTSIHNISPSLTSSWLAESPPPIELRSLESQLFMDEKGTTLKSEGHAIWPLDETNTIDISWLASCADPSSEVLHIDELRIGADTKDIITANGNLPISIRWIQGSSNVNIDEDAPFTISLNSSPHPDFWNALNEMLPVSVKRPILDANLSGSLNSPKGNFDLTVDSFEWLSSSDDERSIVVHDLKAALAADSSALSIKTLEAYAGGNRILAKATLPLKKSSLAEMLQRPDLFDIDSLAANAVVELNDLAALKAWLPEMIRHEGQASIEVGMKGGELSAEGTLNKLATRPLPPLGALSKISGSFRFANGVWITEGITGTADKSPFTLVGKADLNSIETPIFDLNFSSKEFPLIRDNGLILSGDVDMNLTTTDQGQTQIQGNLILKKGLALIEPDLMASSTKTVSTRPPYFAVEQAPFDDWGLDIEIRGDQFLKVSNSFFQGTLSAEFDLEGNLGTPLLIGKAETYGGRIFFPASSLKLKSGQAFITRDEPSLLQIEAQAEGRLFAYDINLSVGGSAEHPELIISSNPAMTQVEALLLLTTGAIPNDGGNLAQQSATSLGVFIGKGLFKKLTGGNSDSASKLNLEVGKDISLQGKKTIEASYQLSEKLELEGEYDKRDEFNANLKWTLFKR